MNVESDGHQREPLQMSRRRGQSAVVPFFAGVPLPLRWAMVGAAAAGVAGGVVGLVIGLQGHPATAWFAVFELGVPSAILGLLVGGILGGIVALFRRCVWPRAVT